MLSLERGERERETSHKSRTCIIVEDGKPMSSHCAVIRASAFPRFHNATTTLLVDNEPDHTYPCTYIKQNPYTHIS